MASPPMQWMDVILLILLIARCNAWGLNSQSGPRDMHSRQFRLTGERKNARMLLRFIIYGSLLAVHSRAMRALWAKLTNQWQCKTVNFMQCLHCIATWRIMPVNCHYFTFHTSLHFWRVSNVKNRKAKRKENAMLSVSCFDAVLCATPVAASHHEISAR